MESLDGYDHDNGCDFGEAHRRPNNFELDAKGATLTSTTEVVVIGPIAIKLN